MARDDDGSGQGDKKKKARSKRKIISYLGWEWYETEKFEMEKLIGKMTAVGPCILASSGPPRSVARASRRALCCTRCSGVAIHLR